MVTCPNCRSTLPDWVQRCHKCNTDLSQEVRTHTPRTEPGARSSKPEKRIGWILYYVFSVLWIFDGARVIIATLGFMKENGTGSPFASWGIIGTVIGVANVSIGVGLILRVEFLRGVANFLCGLNLLGAGFGVVGAILVAPVLGAVGLVAVVISILYCLVYGLQIWAIGETD